jgi:hypothetical protein
MSKFVWWLLGIVGSVIAAMIIWWLTGPGSPIPQPTQIPIRIPTPTPGLRRVSIKGIILDIDLPDWITDPSNVRGSITFNSNDEIASTGKLTVRLSIRNENGSRWKESVPKPVLELRSGEHLCSIEPAAYNTASFYLGLKAHCDSSDSCSYNIEGNRLWATIGNVEVVIAPQGVQCPNR